MNWYVPAWLGGSGGTLPVTGNSNLLEREARRARRGLRRNADPAGKNGTSLAARRPLEVGELRKTREYLPPNVSWKLNVLYDAPCARREPVRRRAEIDYLGFTDLRQAPERIVAVYAP